MGNLGGVHRPYTAALDGLLVKVAHGDRQAFSDFYVRTSGRIYGLIKHMVADPDDCKDVLEVSYLRIWQQAPEFDPTEQAALPWAVALAHRCAIEQVQQDGGPATPFEDAGQRSHGDSQASVTAECSEKQLLEYTYYGGMTCRCLAERLEVSQETVRSRIHHGLLNPEQAGDP